MTIYTVTTFYRDLLRERFNPVEIVRSINVSHKLLTTNMRCGWKSCTNRSKVPCANLKCRKVACDKAHSYLLCLECCKKNVQKLSIIKEPRKVKCTRCTLYRCKNRTTLICCIFGCDQPVCDLHRAKLCNDCCFNMGSSAQYNFSEKLPKPLQVSEVKPIEPVLISK